MTLRLTAAVAAVVIAIALVAAFLAAQRPTTSNVPAASTTAYRNMIYADHDALINTYSSSACVKFTDATCAEAIGGIKDAATKWAADVRAFQTPPQFAVVDRQLRQHLDAMITVLGIATEAIAANSPSAFSAAVYDFGQDHEAPWFDRMAGAIVHSQAATLTQYRDVVSAQKGNLDSCGLCLELGGSSFTDCADPTSHFCWSDVSVVSNEIALVFGASVITAAPSVFGSRDAQLQSDLANADTAILDLEIALISGSPAGTNDLPSEFGKYRRALSAIQSDIAAILG